MSSALYCVAVAVAEVIEKDNRQVVKNCTRQYKIPKKIFGEYLFGKLLHPN